MEDDPPHTEQGHGRAGGIARAAAAVAALIAVVAVTHRWLDDPGAGRAVQPVVTPIASLGLLLASAALHLVLPARAAAARRAGRVIAAATAAVGLGVLGWYALRWNAHAGPPTLARAWWMQRPGLFTALGLACIGTALFALGSPRERARRRAGPGAVATLAIALTVLIGHAYGATVLYGMNRWGGTAVPTAIALAALGLGALFADPSRGVAAVFLSASPAGRLLRRMVPAALVAPVLLGWLALEAHERNLIDVAFAAALLIVLLIVLLAGLAASQAKAVHAAESARELLLARERDARAQVTTILESITDAFFAVDRAWRFTYANHEAERLLRRPREELIGRSIWTEFPEAVGATFEREYRRAVAERTTVQFEEYFPPLETWFDVRAYPTADGLSVYFSNITARKRAEEQLRQSEERYRLLADMIPQHIWTTDPGGYHTYFSRRWYEFTGARPTDTEGTGWLEFLHPDDRARTIERWQHALRTGEPYSIEYRFRSATGAYRWFWGHAMPERNAAGDIVQWVGTLTDISERKRLDAERELLLTRERAARAEADRRREALERVTESRARLIRGFSHDLKNPLGAADGYAALLADEVGGPLTEWQQRSVHRIRRSIQTSLRLINDLLELEAAEAGRIDLRVERLDAAALAREIVEDFRGQADAVGLVLEVDAPAALPTASDPARVRQVLSNLISNAVKYTRQGRVTVATSRHVEDRAPRPGEWVAIRVIDTGPGIPPEKQEVIFQEFTRLDLAAPHGAGVGLAISRRIAHLLGGDVTVESAVGRGSTFTLWLPYVSGALVEPSVA